MQSYALVHITNELTLPNIGTHVDIVWLFSYVICGTPGHLYATTVG